MATSHFSDETKSTASGTTLLPAVHERLIAELESTEGQLGAIVRALYDDDEQEEFLLSLQSRVKLHEKDIERMCNKNYQGFIESVTELVKVKSEAHKLRNKVENANRTIQDSGRELLKQAQELHTARTIQKNMMATIEALTLCIPVLEMYSKLQWLMSEKHFYSALKTLEQLEHSFLPRVRGYIFSELLADEIPKMRASIERQSRSELTEYLAKVRETSVHIGEVAMHQTLRQSKLDVAGDVRMPLDPEMQLDHETCAQDLVDFAPVYRCLHIHSVLGKEDKFTEDYRSHRNQQLRLVIKPPVAWAGRIEDYKKYFYGIAGFFVVEDSMMHASQSLGGGHKGEGAEGLISRPVLDEFWDMATSEMLSVLRSNCLSCKDNHLLLKVKQLIVWFCHTINGYGLNAEKLYEVLLEIREHYEELLMRTYGDAFRNLLETDDYTPVVVNTTEQFEGVLDMFPYDDIVVKRASFPKQLPFSAMVYQIFNQIKSYVERCTNYADRLNLSRTEIDENVRKSVNLLLTKSMSGCLATLLEKVKLTVHQLTQLWVNLDQWENAEEHLDMYIASVTGVPRSDIVQSNRLYGFSVFRDAKLSTQSRIVDKLRTQISEVMDDAYYDWTPKDPDLNTRRPSDFLEDALQFLLTSFQIVSVLPDEVIDDVCVHLVQHVVDILEYCLLNDKVLRVSIEGLKVFDIDVKRCESFVKTNAAKLVPRLKSTAEGGAQTDLGDSIFARLRQLINMFLNNEWTEYISELTTCTAKKFPAVPPENVHNLLTKLLESERKKKRKFHSGSSALKERLKYYDLILKRLQGFINEGHHSAPGGGGGGGSSYYDDDDDGAVLRAHEKKKKKKAVVVSSRKKDPLHIKDSLKKLEEILADRQNPHNTAATRIAGKGEASIGRTSPLLYHQPKGAEPNT